MSYNNNLWTSTGSYSDANGVSEEEIKNVKSIKMIAAQRQHVKKLQENLEADESRFFRVFTSIPGWEMFISKHTSSYQRPRDVIPYLKKYFRSLEIEFDKEEGLPNTAKFIITYANGNGYKSYNHMKFRTNPIPISDIEEFIQNRQA